MSGNRTNKAYGLPHFLEQHQLAPAEANTGAACSGGPCYVQLAISENPSGMDSIVLPSSTSSINLTGGGS